MVGSDVRGGGAMGFSVQLLGCLGDDQIIIVEHPHVIWLSRLDYPMNAHSSKRRKYRKCQHRIICTKDSTWISRFP